MARSPRSRARERRDAAARLTRRRDQDRAPDGERTAKLDPRRPRSTRAGARRPRRAARRRWPSPSSRCCADGPFSPHDHRAMGIRGRAARTAPPAEIAGRLSNSGRRRPDGVAAVEAAPDEAARVTGQPSRHQRACVVLPAEGDMRRLRALVNASSSRRAEHSVSPNQAERKHLRDAESGSDGRQRAVAVERPARATIQV